MKRTHKRPQRLFLIGLIFLTCSHTPSAQTVRQIFPRNGTYEYQMLKAMNFNPNPGLTNIDLNETIKSYSQLNPLEKAFGGLALIAAEVHYKNLPNTTPESALKDIANATIPEIRKQVVGYLGALIVNAIAQNGQDELTKAVKTWATGIYRSFKIRSAKGILDEYNKWKLDPCNYKADGYKAPVDCALKGMNFTQWYSTHKPPEDILAKAGMKSVVANNADAMASGIALGVYAVTIGASAIAVTSGLGVIVGSTIVNTTATPILLSCSSLSAAFGGSAGMAGGAGAIGAVSWVGVVAAPVAAAILVIVVGTTEGIRVVEAEKVGPMLKMKVGTAMTSPIEIVNELQTNKDAVSMFYMAFIESSLKGFQYTEPKVDGEARFYCQAGYVSQFKLSYTLKASSPFEQDKVVNQTTNNLAVGQEQTFAIPYNAINIKVRGLYAAGDWKEIFNTTLSQPTYICYTTYGTVFKPAYKTDCPEVGSMVSKANELTVTQGGAYAAWVYLSYKQNGKVVVAQDQRGLTMGWRKVYKIPADATQVYLYIREATGLVWDPWKAVVEKTWPNPPNECVKIYGTTLDPKWNAECN